MASNCRQGNKARPPKQLSDGITTKEHIVPIVHRWLRGGVSSNNLRSSVRIKDMNTLTGGLKSPAVGDVTVSVRVIVKQGPEELVWHKSLMNEINRRAQHRNSRNLQKAIFPEAMFVEYIEDLPSPYNYLIVQQALVGYNTLHDLLYKQNASIKRLEHCIMRGIPAIQFIHEVTPLAIRPLRKLHRTPDPFTHRLEKRLKKLKKDVNWLASVYRSGAKINEYELPPLSKVLRRVKKWQEYRTKSLLLKLVHGDPHIANLMVRKRGANESVRWIDPNPKVGFSDPAYDWGKLLHFIEPVGWAKHSNKSVILKVRRAKSGTVIKSALNNIACPIEKTRARLEDKVRSMAVKALSYCDQAEALLELAIASAHIGYASMDIDPKASYVDRRTAMISRQFALALTLRSLARWGYAVNK